MEGGQEKEIRVDMGAGFTSIPRSRFDNVVAVADEVASEGRIRGFIKVVALRSEETKGAVMGILRKRRQMNEYLRKAQERGK
jgi:hypothetical protein